MRLTNCNLAARHVQSDRLQGGGNPGSISGVIGIATATLTVGRTVLNGAAQNDTGTWTLTGATANTYTGATTVNSGTLILGKTASVAAMSSTSLVVGDGQGGAAADVVQFATSANQLLATCVVSINQASGKMDLNNTNQQCGGLTDVITQATGTQGLVTLGSGTLSLSTTGGTYSGTITGTGGLTLAGGTQTLASANSYSGITTLTGGTLVVGNDGALGTNSSATALTISGATTIQSVGNRTIANPLTITSSFTTSGSGSLKFTGAVALNTASTLTCSTTAGVTELAGQITSSVLLTRAGTGTLRLSGSNTTWTGGTAGLTLSVAAAAPLATLQIANDNALGTGLLTVGITGIAIESIGSHSISNAVTTSGALTFSVVNGGNLTIGGTLTMGGATTFNNSTTVTLNGLVNGAFLLTKGGGGNLVLNPPGPTASWSGGLTLSGGTLTIGNSNALGTGTLTFATNGVIIQDNGAPVACTNTIQTNSDIICNGSNAITLGNAQTSGFSSLPRNITVNSTGVLTFNWIISSGSIIKNGPGTLRLTQANTFTTAAMVTTVNAGKLQLKGDTATLGATTAVNLNGGTLEITNEGTLNPDRIGNAVPVNFNGGTLSLSAPPDTDRSETVGAVTFSSGSSSMNFTSVSTTGCGRPSDPDSCVHRAHARRSSADLDDEHQDRARHGRVAFQHHRHCTHAIDFERNSGQRRGVGL